MNCLPTRWLRLNCLFAGFFLSWLLPLPSAIAQSVTCTATMTNVNFGSVDLIVPSGGSTTATLNYKCTNSANTAKNVGVCFSIGDGSQGFASGFTRQMSDGSTNRLLFQLYWPDNVTIWGSSGFGSLTPYSPAVFQIAKNASVSGSVTMQARINVGQTAPPPATYTDSFAGIHTAIAHSESNPPSNPAGCGGFTDAGIFGYTVSANVVKSCTVGAGASSNIQIGAAGGVDFNAGSSSGSNSISVACSNTTPYFIGLAPSNNNTAGAGVMSGTGGNTDKVPYQLRSGSVAGPVWGNTATSISVGNGLSGTGSGSAQSISVFAIAPSANFTPDSYSDTVTVNVNY